jgi:transcriptional regulator GlxA family with amidase domain
MARDIRVLVFPGFQILDATGPIAAFEIAARFQPGAYSIGVIAESSGPVQSSSAVLLHADGLPRFACTDTLVVAGGFGTREAAKSPRLARFLKRQAQRARRVVSVCSGAYLLAEAGLLDRKRATTHWSRADDFRRRYPRVHLEPDRIYVKDGAVWTSAGISAGIDLALALIAEDLGDDIARRTAQQLVVYYRRPGGQSQFSALLSMERADGRFASLLDYIRSNMTRRLSVEDLAEQAGMSPRHFARLFRTETGTTPARAVDRLRAEAARAALQSGHRSLQTIARACGYGSTERMRRSFQRAFGTVPAALRAHA